jgi:hypothetical protein
VKTHLAKDTSDNSVTSDAVESLLQESRNKRFQMKPALPLLALALSATVVAAVDAREPSPNELLAIGEQAVLPAPPSVVADYAEQGSWSNDSRYVLAWRNAIRLPFNLQGEPLVDSGIWLWSAQTGRSREIWQSRLLHRQNTPLEWLHGASIALTTVEVPPVQPDPAIMHQGDRWIARIDARAGTVKLTARIHEYGTVQVAPRVPYGFARDGEGRLRLVKSDGLLSQEITLPNGLSALEPIWGTDGATLLIGTFSQEKPAQMGQTYGFDPRTGKLRPVDSPRVPWTEPEPKGVLRLLHSRGDLRDGMDAVPLKPLWLTARDGARPVRTLITPDADWAKLSPTGDGVLYLQDGTLMVRRIVSFPRVAVDKAVEAAQRAKIMSDCRQIGLAVHLYAADNKDELPGQDQPLDAAVAKHLMNDSIFQGFVYTYGGGKLIDIGEPSKAILGYKLGPGGRANLFADGHVMWEADM